jgi:cell division ATPase FtsA
MLNGINRAARDQLGMSARVVGPQNLGGLTDQVSTPPYAAASGLLLWGSKNWTLDDQHAGNRSLDGLSGRIGKLFRGLMP